MKRWTAWGCGFLAAASLCAGALAAAPPDDEHACRLDASPAAAVAYELLERQQGVWGGVNPAQRFEALISERGIAVRPIGRPDPAHGGWSWSLELVKQGSPSDLQESEGGWPAVLGAEAELDRGSLVESFLNSRKGVWHRLTLPALPDNGILILDFALEGSLSAKIASDGQSIVFPDRSGAPILAWRALRVRDAEGREVSARWESAGDDGLVRRLRLIVDPAGQPAPMTVQGLIVSPKRATLAAGTAGTTEQMLLPPEPALAAPSNDSCGGAEVVPAGGPFPWTSSVHDVTDATTTGDPATPSCQTDLSRSIWFRFTPSSPGLYSFSLCADAPTLTTLEDTVLALYTSTGSCSGLTEVAGGCDDDSCSAGELQSRLGNIALTAGTTYYLVAWKFDASAPSAGSADIQLLVSQGSPGAAPPNDQCAGATVIPGAGPFPWTSQVVADISDATTFGDPAAPSCQSTVSRSVWYSFTPATSGSYTFTTCADAGLGTTVDDTVLALYASSGTCSGLVQVAGACDDDSCAVELGQSVLTGVSLTGGTTYYLLAWQYDTPPPAAGNTAIQVKVSQTLGPGNDTCAGAIPLALDTPVPGTTAGAVNDLQLPAGSACFTGVGQTVTTASGADALYRFTAPAEGAYSFRITGYDLTRNAVVYASTDCPGGPAPATVAGCLAAANRHSGSTAEEVMCLALSAGQQIWLAVDEAALTAGSAFTIEANACTRESEPNGATATANALACGVEGSAAPTTDADFFYLGAPSAGSRVFALVDGVAANTADFDLRVTSSADTLEFDDGNNDLPFGGTAPNIAGAALTGADAWLRVNHLSTTLQVEPYRLYGVVQRPAASATGETEPNNTPGAATSGAGLYFSGALGSTSDIDHFSFSAQAGELVTIGLDLDPVRDNTPFNGTLALLDGAGVVLVQVNDSGSTSSTTPGTGSFVIKTPNSPAEAIAYRIRSSGTYMARISTTSGTAGDYLLSIARNCRIGPATNLSVAVTDSPDPVPPGGQVVYTVTVSNTGSQAATFVTLRNDLPAGSALVSAAPSQGGCSGAGPVICPLGTLAAGTGAIVQITITAPGAPGAITHAARVTSMVLDSNPTDDLAQQVTTVGQADSDGDGTADADDCAPGDPSAWAVPDDATDLLFSGPGTSAIQWTAPAATGGSGLRYDLVRSVSGGDFSSIDCIATDQAGTSASDLGIPVNLYFYLVRAENACGGTLGASSGGTPHTAPSCP